MAYCTLRVRGPLQAQLMGGQKTVKGLPRPGHPHQKPTVSNACARLQGEPPTCGQLSRELSWLYAKPPQEKHHKTEKHRFDDPPCGSPALGPVGPTVALPDLRASAVRARGGQGAAQSGAPSAGASAAAQSSAAGGGAPSRPSRSAAPSSTRVAASALCADTERSSFHRRSHLRAAAGRSGSGSERARAAAATRSKWREVRLVRPPTSIATVVSRAKELPANSG